MDPTLFKYSDYKAGYATLIRRLTDCYVIYINCADYINFIVHLLYTGIIIDWVMIIILFISWCMGLKKSPGR